MKNKFLLLSGLIFCATTYANDFTWKTSTANRNWGTKGNWMLNGASTNELPGQNDKIYIGRTNHPALTNDLPVNLRKQIIYKSDAPAMTIGGAVENIFVGDNQSIDNESGKAQVIDFPIKVGERENSGVAVVVKPGYLMTFNKPININGNTFRLDGQNTKTVINCVLTGRNGHFEVVNGTYLILKNDARVKNSEMLVQGSTIQFEGDANLDAGTNLKISNSAVIDLKNSDVEVESLSEENKNTLNIGTGRLIVNGDARIVSTLRNSLFEGTGTLVNNGAGTINLYNTKEGTSKFGGSVEVRAGKIALYEDDIELRKISVAGGATFESNVNVNTDTLSTLPGATLRIANGKTIVVKGVLALGEGTNITGGGKIDATRATIIATSLPLPNYVTCTTAPDITVASGTTLKISGRQAVGTLTMMDDENNGQSALQYLNAGALSARTVKVVQTLLSSRNYYMSNPVGSSLPAGATYYNYNENTHGSAMSNYWTTCTQIGRGLGFIALAHGPATLTFTGAINDNDVTVHLTRGGTIKAGFNLVGNPYLSYLNAGSLLQGNSDMEKTLWYRTKSGRVYNFQTLNVISGVSTSNATSTVPPMQGFWVRTTNPNGCDLKIKHSMVTNGTSRLRTAPVQNGVLLRLEVSAEGVADETVLYENANATYGFDDYDSHKMSNDNANIPELYTVDGADQLAINGIPSVQLNKEIPLGFKTMKDGYGFKIKVKEIDNLDADVRLILNDNGQETDITDGETYTFDSEKYDGTGRFNLIFRSSGVATAVKNTDEQKTYALQNADGNIQVISSDIENGVVDVYNAVGQFQSEKALINGNTIIDNIHTPGAYWVKIKNNKLSVTRKIIVK